MDFKFADTDDQREAIPFSMHPGLGKVEGCLPPKPLVGRGYIIDATAEAVYIDRSLCIIDFSEQTTIGGSDGGT